MMDSSSQQLIFSSKSVSSENFYFSTSQLFEMITKYLWFYHYDCLYYWEDLQRTNNPLRVTMMLNPKPQPPLMSGSENSGNIDQEMKEVVQEYLLINQFWFPKLIQVDNVKYDEGN
jgi:hypothetical protein